MVLKDFALDLPFTGGLDEASDEATSNPPQLLRASNALFLKRGAVRRRPAMTAVSPTNLTGQRGNAILAKGGGAHVITDNGVYGYNPTQAQWQATNPRGIHPCQVKTDPAVRVENDNVMQPDQAYVSGYVATVWFGLDPTTFSGAPTSATRCFVQVVELASGVVVTPPTMLPATMLGVPHVVGVNSRFVVTAQDASGHLRVCTFAPGTAIPTTATDFTSAAVTIYDVVSFGGAALYVVAVPSAGLTTFNAYELDNTGAVLASKTGNATSVGVSIRGISACVTPLNSRLVVAYVDGTGATYTDSQLWVGHLPANLSTWTETGSVHGHFSPRTGANGPSLAYADVTVCPADGTGAVFVAWSCMLGTTSAGVLAKLDTAVGTPRCLTAATDSCVFELDGVTLRSGVGCTRGYRLVGKATGPLGTTSQCYVPLGWVGGQRLKIVDSGGGTVHTPTLTDRDPANDTLYPAMILCTPLTGTDYDATQDPPTTLAATILAAVARFNRDVAYSYIYGSASLPSIAQIWTTSSVTIATEMHLVAPVKKIAGEHLASTIVFEANSTTFDIGCKPLRKVTANGGVYTDGGYDGGYDGVASFETSLHQAPEAVQYDATVYNDDAGAVGGWHVLIGEVGSWYCGIAFTWQDADGNTHRSPLSTPPTLTPLTIDMTGGAAHDSHRNVVFTLTDPGALSAIEHYGRSNVRIQLYVSKNTTGTGASSDATPYLLVDDVIGSDTRRSPDGTIFDAGYKIGMNSAAGLIYIIATVPTNPNATVLIPHYTLGGTLAAEPSHALRELVAWQDRLVGIDAEDRYRLPYTKPLEQRIAPEWNGDLSIRLEGDGGEAVALAVMDEKIIVLRERGLGVVIGTGATATGINEQLSYQPLPGRLGCTARNSVVVVDDGLLFLSQLGPVLLDRGLNISRPKSLPDTFADASCAVVVPHLHTVLWGEVFSVLDKAVFVHGSVALDYEEGKWSTWLPYGARDMVVIGERIWRLDTTGQNGTQFPSATPCVATESTTETDGDPQGAFPLDVQCAWLKTGGISGFQRLRRCVVRAVAGATGLTIQFYVDYDKDTDVGSSVWTAAEVAALTGGQFEMHIPVQKCAAASFRVRQTDTTTGGLVIEGITLRGGRKGTETKRLPAGARR